MLPWVHVDIPYKHFLHLFDYVILFLCFQVDFRVVWFYWENLNKDFGLFDWSQLFPFHSYCENNVQEKREEVVSIYERTQGKLKLVWV